MVGVHDSRKPVSQVNTINDLFPIVVCLELDSVTLILGQRLHGTFPFGTVAVTYQTGKYVVRAEDLPRASKLPLPQQPIKCAEFEKYNLKVNHFIWGGDTWTVFPSAQI